MNLHPFKVVRTVGYTQKSCVKVHPARLEMQAEHLASLADTPLYVIEEEMDALEFKRRHGVFSAADFVRHKTLKARLVQECQE